MPQVIEINKGRLDFLLTIYRLSKEELLGMLNEGRKRLYVIEDVYNDTIALTALKNIDKIFCKGLLFYQDFTDIKHNAGNSVFFRKKAFETQLNRESIRIVHKFETDKSLLDAYASLSHFSVGTKMDRHSLKESPREVANAVRPLFVTEKKCKKDRDLLVSMIGLCAEQGIYVFEYIEAHNKKDKTNIDGFFLNPDMIVLKRQSYSYKREIFTLAHEIGHCLLGVEEAENVDDATRDAGVSEVERWCNDFAFYLLLGRSASRLDPINAVDSSNDYCHDLVCELSSECNISRTAIYTQLFYSGKLDKVSYASIKSDLDREFCAYVEEAKEKSKNSSGHPAPPKPIMSPLFIETMQYALYKGVIEETTFCERTGIKGKNLKKYMEW